MKYLLVMFLAAFIEYYAANAEYIFYTSPRAVNLTNNCIYNLTCNASSANPADHKCNLPVDVTNRTSNVTKSINLDECTVYYDTVGWCYTNCPYNFTTNSSVKCRDIAAQNFSAEVEINVQENLGEVHGLIMNNGILSWNEPKILDGLKVRYKYSVTKNENQSPQEYFTENPKANINTYTNNQAFCEYLRSKVTITAYAYAPICEGSMLSSETASWSGTTRVPALENTGISVEFKNKTDTNVTISLSLSSNNGCPMGWPDTTAEWSCSWFNDSTEQHILDFPDQVNCTVPINNSIIVALKFKNQAGESNFSKNITVTYDEKNLCVKCNDCNITSAWIINEPHNFSNSSCIQITEKDNSIIQSTKSQNVLVFTLIVSTLCILFKCPWNILMQVKF